MEVRILYVRESDPWISCEHLIEYFNLTNPTLQTIERIMFQNALPLMENVGWRIVKVIEQEDLISVLFIKMIVDE